MDFDAGLLVVDVSDPKIVDGFAIFGKHMLIAAGEDGLVVMDISDPGNPVPISKIKTPESVREPPRDIEFIDEKTALVACGAAGLVAVDLKDPKNPSLIFRKAYGNNVYSVAVTPDRRYALIGYDYCVASLDISDLNSVREISRRSLAAPVSTTIARDIEVCDGWVFIADDRFSPSLAKLEEGGMLSEIIFHPQYYTGLYQSGVVVSNGYAFIAHNSGLVVVDVKDKANPKLVSSQNIACHGKGIALLPENKVLINGNYLFRIDVSDPRKPGESDVLFVESIFCERLLVQDGLIFIAEDDEYLEIFDLNAFVEAKPRTHVEPLRKIAMASAIDVALSGRYAFVVQRARGITVLDAWDVRRMKPRAISHIDVKAGRIAVKGRYLIASCKDGIKIIDVMDVKNPKVISTLQLKDRRRWRGGIWRLKVIDDALLAADAKGFTVIDLSAPRNPKIVAEFDAPLFGWDFYLDGDTVYFTDAGDLFIFKIPFERIIDVSPKGNLLTGYGTIKNMGTADLADRPMRTALLQNFPNPFNSETWIPYQISRETDVLIRIYDVKGRLVRTFDLGRKRAGYYTSREEAAYWDGRDEHGEEVASGVYFYTLSAGGFSETRRMVIRR
ncbi:T9SS type A sorting domain-containing protein [Candidatus Poribacteria bacterium]|nr:T9SS type A sorting domain-containing protein [Candidatus Poribacteria bacterium]